MNSFQRLGRKPGTWPRLWIVLPGSGRSGFARRMVASQLLDAAVTWFDAALVAVIMIAGFLPDFPAAGFGAVLAAMAAVMLGAVAILLLPAAWRYRGSALFEGIGMLAGLWVLTAVAAVTAGLLVETLFWPWVVLAASAAVAVLSAVLLVASIKGLAAADLA